ncbi:MAG: tetratricopeptide repeat protein, partial [Terriglobales bacterium]
MQLCHKARMASLLPALLLMMTIAPLPIVHAAMQEAPEPFEADLRAAREAAELGDTEKAMALTDPWLAQAEKQKEMDFMLVMQLDLVAGALRKAERYAESERIHSRLLAAAEKLQAEGVAGLQLKGLAEGYSAQKKYAEAEPLLRRLLALQEKSYGDPNHPRLAVQIYDLAENFRLQGKAAEAEPLYRRALKLMEDAVGADDPNVTPPLDGLADSLKLQGKFDEAEALFKRSLAIMKQVAGESADTALKLANLADFYRFTKRFPEAEPLFESAIAMYEKTAPADNGFARALENYAAQLRATQRPKEAEKLEARAREMRAAPPEVRERSAPGPTDAGQPLPESALAAPIRNLETALDAGDFAGAEKLLGPLLEQVGTAGPPLEALSLLPLVERYEALGKLEPAERIALRMLEVLEQAGGPANPFLVPAVDKLAHIYQAQKRWSDAEVFLKRSLAITEAAYREEGMSDANPRVFSAIEALAELYMAAGRFTDAEAMFQRMITAMKKFYGKDAPMLDLVWTRLGDAARMQQHYAEAEAAYQRAIAAAGKDNPFRDAALVGLAGTFAEQGKYKEAEPLYQQAIAAQQEVLGPENPDLIGTLEKYAALL